jgi:hypothetical protein
VSVRAPAPDRDPATTPVQWRWRSVRYGIKWDVTRFFEAARSEGDSR